MGCEDPEVSEEEEDDELEVEREWVEGGVFSGDNGLPEGDPLPDGTAGAPGGDGSEPFTRVGIGEFVTEGLGMGPDWRGER